MKGVKLDNDENFVVRESAGLNFIFAGFFWAVFISLIINFSDNYTVGDKWMSLIVGLIVIAAALFFTIKGLKRKECIRINKDGFFYYRRFITDWENLESAFITQDEKIVSIQDNFVLVLNYNKEGEEGSYMRKIALTNTQNKSEEEILAAIKYFWKE